LQQGKPRKRDLAFRARAAPARAHLRAQSPTGAHKSAHRPSRLPPNHARRAVDFRRSLRMLHCRASSPSRTGVTAASLEAADEAGSARETIKTDARGETIGATVVADCDKMPASSDKAAVIP